MKRMLPALLIACTAACAGAKGQEIRQAPVVQPFIPAGPLGSTAPVKSAARPDPVLVPGDVLRISVYRQPDLDLEVRILDTGCITYPLIGSLQAVGKTAATLEQAIKKALEKDYLENASVSVHVKEYAKRKVYIAGGVAKPDAYEVAPDSRLTVFQLVAAAGGFTDRAYKEYAQVLRRKGQERTVFRISMVDMEKRIARGEADADLELWPDDLVLIPSAVRVAYVLGQVQRPGPMEVPLNTRMTVSMAVANAGSYTKFASTGSLQVLRHTPWGQVSQRTVNLDAILDGRVDLDMEIEPGDVVWVPERGIF